MLSWPDVIPSPIRDVDSTKKDIEQTILNTSTTQQLPQFNAPSIKGNKQTTSLSKVQTMDKTKDSNDINKCTMLSWPDVIPNPIRGIDSTREDIEKTVSNAPKTQQLPDFKDPSSKENKQTTSVSKVQNWIKVNEQHHQEQEKCKKINTYLNSVW